METALAAEPGAALDATRLNKILNGLNTQVRAVETPAVDDIRRHTGQRANWVPPNVHRTITTLNDQSRRSAILPSIYLSTSATLGCSSRAKIVITGGDCLAPASQRASRHGSASPADGGATGDLVMRSWRAGIGARPS
ncbi:hypothetical protein FHG89_25080 [Micromonospora orduensis]|uniref:Uncharacterized protein n=1 Tax=Micromonospora orduensis TaxID=1420891 RepID=A0A5C4QE99_9ACTN|nr:hypothetical protein FHG89_25080 [Micromonospora orduensis]